MKSSLKLNFLYSLLYNAINVLAPFIITPYVARVLGVENMGIYSYSYSVAYYFLIFAMLGVANYGNRSIAAIRDSKTERTNVFWDIYYLQMILSLLSIFVYILYSFFLSSNIKISLLLGLYVMSAALDITWFYQGMENFKIVLIRNFAVKLVNLILVFLLVKKERDLYIYALIVALGFLWSNALLWISIKRYIGFKKINLRNSLKHLKPNFILFIPVIAISIYNFMDKIMLGNMADMTQVGYYDNAEKIITIPQTIVTSLGAIMLPRISNLIATGSNTVVRGYLKKSLIFVAFVSSACTFGIITVSKEFVLLYLGKDYLQCVILLYMLMPCLIFKAYANVLRTQYIIPKKYDNIYLTSVCLGAIINLVINLLLIKKYQAFGACIGTIVAEILVCIYQYVHVTKEMKITKCVLLGFGFQLIGIIMFYITSLIGFSGGTIIILLQKVLVGGIIYLMLSTIYFLILRKTRELE